MNARFIHEVRGSLAQAQDDGPSTSISRCYQRSAERPRIRAGFDFNPRKETTKRNVAGGFDEAMIRDLFTMNSEMLVEGDFPK